jgi:hypothetical protein
MQARLLLLVALVPALTAQITPSAAPDNTIPVPAVVIPGGLCGELYYLPQGADKLPDFEKLELEPIGAMYTDGLNVTPRKFSAGFPGITWRFEWFAIDFRGRFWIENPGVYRFALTSDDGSKLYIDNTLLINLDGIHDAQFGKAGKVNLSDGFHRIRLSYFQGPRTELALFLEIQPPNGRWKLFDMSEFKPPSNAEERTFNAATDVLPSPSKASRGDSQSRRRLALKDPIQEERLVVRCPADW